MLIETAETLARFILQRNWIRPSDNTVKHAAFMPNPHNGETSVFRIAGLNDQDVWQIGDREVAARRDKPLLGRADIHAFNVVSKELHIVPNEPPPRHANIVGWPDEKSKQLQIAVELAAEAQFHSKP
jgi:hypothetical protein